MPPTLPYFRICILSGCYEVLVEYYAIFRNSEHFLRCSDQMYGQLTSSGRVLTKYYKSLGRLSPSDSVYFL